MLNIYGAPGFASCALSLAGEALVPTALLIMQAIPHQGAASAAVSIARLVDGAVKLRWVLKCCR